MYRIVKITEFNLHYYTVQKFQKFLWWKWWEYVTEFVEIDRYGDAMYEVKKFNSMENAQNYINEHTFKTKVEIIPNVN
jgi:hypothetical protein